jgi:hypothetical protein
LRRLVKAILLGEWDPLLLHELPDFLMSNADEYDRYVDLIVRMIADGCDSQSLETQIHKLEVRISGHKLPDIKTVSVARRLPALKSEG